MHRQSMRVSYEPCRRQDASQYHTEIGLLKPVCSCQLRSCVTLQTFRRFAASAPNLPNPLLCPVCYVARLQHLLSARQSCCFGLEHFDCLVYGHHGLRLQPQLSKRSVIPHGTTDMKLQQPLVEIFRVVCERGSSLFGLIDASQKVWLTAGRLGVEGMALQLRLCKRPRPQERDKLVGTWHVYSIVGGAITTANAAPTTLYGKDNALNF